MLPLQAPVALSTTSYIQDPEDRLEPSTYYEYDTSRTPGSEGQLQLSPFEQTQKEQDEAFYRQFPDARRAVEASPWEMVAMPPGGNPLGSFVFSFKGAAGLTKTSQSQASPTESPAESSLWAAQRPVSPPQCFRDESQPYLRHSPSYCLSGALTPSPPHLNYDYSSPHAQCDCSSPPESVLSAQDSPSSPMHSSFSESLHGQSGETFYINAYPVSRPEQPYDAFHVPVSTRDPYMHPPDKEPIMDFLEPPASPTPEADPPGPVPSPSEASSSQQLPYPLSKQSSSPGPQYALSEMTPLGRKSRRHAPPVPMNPHYYHKTAQSQPGLAPPPLGPTYPRRQALSPPPAKPADKKPPLACFFCRTRKIACNAPSPDDPDRTCNQCSRRKLICEYPKESRRGMRKNQKKPGTSSMPHPETGQI